MKKLSLILFSLSILFFTNYSQTEEKLIYGKAKVIDGDTIKINGQNIRLQGIDAPEMKQSCKDQNNSSYACGQVSKNFLDSIVLNESLTVIISSCNFSPGLIPVTLYFIF